MRSALAAATKVISARIPGAHSGAARRNVLVVLTYLLVTLLAVGVFEHLTQAIV